jgi:hypothetical protein
MSVSNIFFLLIAHHYFFRGRSGHRPVSAVMSDAVEQAGVTAAVAVERSLLSAVLGQSDDSVGGLHFLTLIYRWCSG